MSLGLDLGTGLAKLARYPTGTGPPAVTAVPTAVAYRDDLSREIPVGTGDGLARPDVVRCDGFVPVLGTSLSASRITAWRNLTPDEAVQGFLRCLIGMVDGEPGPGPAAAPAELVVAVPAAWLGEQDAASELAEALTTLGWPPRRLVAAPVAALLQLRHEDPDLARASRFVVADAGAGSVDLSLVTATGPRLRVTDSIRLVGRSAWTDDTQPDVPGNRPPTLAECLVTALAAAAGAPRASMPGRESVRRWRALESELADDARRDRLEAVLQQAAADRYRHGGTMALRFAGLEVTASQFLDACDPLAARAGAALGQLLSRQAEPGWSPAGVGDHPRLVLLGGLTGLSPLREAVLAALGLDPDRPADGLVQPGGTDRLSVTARGAALLAAGQADPGDRYPHELRLQVSRVLMDRMVTEYLQLAAPGVIDLDDSRVRYLTAPGGTGHGGELQVTVRAAADQPDAPPVPVQIIPAGGEMVPVAFQAVPHPAPGVYRVGVRGGPDGPAVILQRTDGGQVLTYPLTADADPAAAGHAMRMHR